MQGFFSCYAQSLLDILQQTRIAITAVLAQDKHMTMAPERPMEMEEMQNQSVFHERRFGSQEILHLPLDSLLMVSQIRGCENAVHSDLKDSIDVEDLDNPINVARLSELKLAEYLDFTNGTWGSNLTVADVEQYRQEDGMFNLVVGGHSRTLCIQELADEHTAATGEITDWSLQCKLLKDTSVQGIVAKQLSENIHKGAPIEREAMAIVEMLRAGLMSGEWSDVDGFQKAMHGKIKRKTVNAAVNFYRLPDQVRAQVYSKMLPYEAGVSLGKGIDDFATLERLKSNLPAMGEIDDEAQKIIDTIVSDKVITLAGRTYNRCKSSSQARMMIMGVVKQDRAQIAAILKSQETGEDESELFAEALFGNEILFNPIKTLKAERERAHRLKVKTLEELAMSPLERATQVLMMLSRGEDSAEVIALQRSTRKSIEMLDKDLSRRAITETDDIDDQIAV